MILDAASDSAVGLRSQGDCRPHLMRVNRSSLIDLQRVF